MDDSCCFPYLWGTYGFSYVCVSMCKVCMNSLNKIQYLFLNNFGVLIAKIVPVLFELVTLSQKI